MVEAFAVNALVKQAAWLDPSLGSVGLFHYRDRNGLEADLVIELPAGRAVAVEVKASATVHPRDWANPARLRGLLGERFAQGVVFYTGSRALPAGDRIHIRPIEALWQPRPPSVPPQPRGRIRGQSPRTPCLHGMRGPPGHPGAAIPAEKMRL